MADEGGYAVPVALQPHYSLLHRRAYETEYVALARDAGLEVYPCRALGGGFLTGKYRTELDLEGRARGAGVRVLLTSQGPGLVDVVRDIADAHDAPTSAVALAWLIRQATVTAPLASTSAQRRWQLSRWRPRRMPRQCRGHDLLKAGRRDRSYAAFRAFPREPQSTACRQCADCHLRLGSEPTLIPRRAVGPLPADSVVGMATPTFFETPRLDVRRFCPADVDAFVAYRADPEVARYQSWSDYTLDLGAALLEDMQHGEPGVPGEWYQFALEDRSTGMLVGDLALKVDEHEHRAAEVGFTLALEQQGRGYATEALRALVGFAFETYVLHRIFAVTDTLNGPANALLERVGMRREGHFVENIYFKGSWGSEFLFAVLDREWAHQT